MLDLDSFHDHNKFNDPINLSTCSDPGDNGASEPGDPVSVSNPFEDTLRVQNLLTGPDLNAQVDLNTFITSSVNSIIDLNSDTQYITTTPNLTTIANTVQIDDLKVNNILNQASTTFIDMTDANDINISCTDLTLNGNTLLTDATTGIVKNPLSSDLAAGGFNLTGIGTGSLENLNSIADQAVANTSTITTLNDKTQNLNAVAGNTELLGIMRHRLVATDSFNVGNDSTPFALNYFRVDNTNVTSQLNHQFSNGLKATVNDTGDIGIVGNRFNNLHCVTSNSDNYNEGGVSGELVKTINTSCTYAGNGAGTTGATGCTFYGANAGATTTATDNTAIGYNALPANTTGTYNTAIGMNGLLNCVTGYKNTALGWASLYNVTSGYHNTSLGMNAGFNLTDGHSNTLIGYKATDNGGTESITRCVAIGSDALNFGNNSIVLGTSVIATKNDQCVIGDANVTEMINMGDNVCDLGTSTNRFKNLACTSINNLTPVGGVYAGVSDGVLVGPGGVETSIVPVSGVGSLTVPGGTFKTGDTYSLVAAGDIPIGDAGDVIQIKVCQNGVCFATMSIDMENSTGTSFFELECDMQIRSIGTTGSIMSNVEFSFNRLLLGDWKGSRHTELSAIDTTIDTTLTVTATFTGQLNSTLQTRLFYLRKQY
jgi:hypothetical protein